MSKNRHCHKDDMRKNSCEYPDSKVKPFFSGCQWDYKPLVYTDVKEKDTCDVFCHTERFTCLTGVNGVLCMTDELDEHSLHVHFSCLNSRNAKTAITVWIYTLHFITLHPSRHRNHGAVLMLLMLSALCWFWVWLPN